MNVQRFYKKTSWHEQRSNVPSNEGHNFDGLIDNMAATAGDAWLADLQFAARSVWSQVHSHPPGASCECPVVEALSAMYDRGYRFHKLTEEELAAERAAALIADTT